MKPLILGSVPSTVTARLLFGVTAFCQVLLLQRPKHVIRVLFLISGSLRGRYWAKNSSTSGLLRKCPQEVLASEWVAGKGSKRSPACLTLRGALDCRLHVRVCSALRQMSRVFTLQASLSYRLLQGQRWGNPRNTWPSIFVRGVWGSNTPQRRLQVQAVSKTRGSLVEEVGTQRW